MLKRRRHFARTRLPEHALAAATTRVTQSAAESLPAQLHSRWPEPPAGLRNNLWISIKFKSLLNENIDYYAELALQYTAMVSIDSNGELLLEVAGSLRLFGGLQALRQRLQATLQKHPQQAVIACALSPRAAVWLTRANRPVACLNSSTLRRELGSLSLELLGWPAKTCLTLQQMGLHTVADCQKLPRDGFARRIGHGYLQELDEAFAERPQLLTPYVPPAAFSAALDLAAETLNVEQLLFAAAQLLQKLERFMRRRQTSVERLLLQLEHFRHLPTRVEIALHRPQSQVIQLHELMALRLERLILPAPVTAIAIQTVTLPVRENASLSLPGIAAASDGADTSLWAQFIDSLRARLGASRVHRLGVIAEHRPEYAWQVAEPGKKYLPEVNDLPPRPLWLLEQPRRITLTADTVPLLTRAERIESGWWDGHDVRRDYYAITGRDGSRWWVYQSCRNLRWYLHGLFG